MNTQTVVGAYALPWVKTELSKNLDEVMRALAIFHDDPAEKDAIRHVQKVMQQICGTLELIEFHGAKLLAEAIESVAHVLADGSVHNQETVLHLVRSSIRQLGKYFDYLEAGDPDIPIMLLPMLNRLRMSLSTVGRLPETAMVFPDVVRRKELMLDTQALVKSDLSHIDLELLGRLQEDLNSNLENMSSQLSVLAEADEIPPGFVYSMTIMLARIADGLRMLALRFEAEQVESVRYDVSLYTADQRVLNKDALKDLSQRMGNVTSTVSLKLKNPASFIAKAPSVSRDKVERHFSSEHLLLALERIRHLKKSLIAFQLQPNDWAAIKTMFDHAKESYKVLVAMKCETEARVLKSVAAYIRQRLGSAQGEVNLQELTTLAEAITAMEMWLEHFRQPAINEQGSLSQLAQECVAQLGFPVGGEATLSGAAKASLEKARVPTPEDSDAVNNKMLSAFADKVEMAHVRLQPYLPMWRRNPENLQMLLMFHQTFKNIFATSQLIGSNTLVELAQKYEQKLYLAVQEPETADSKLIDKVEIALQRMPELSRSFDIAEMPWWAKSTMIQRAESSAPVN